mmetsp:Transcript_13923/g.44152  ORF Transcript_13923/g.44152 Transcript_13923/m.44152 type:complete len:371 (+) Transcript_13923:305-1417(+)
MDLKVLPEPRVPQHGRRVAAHQERLALLDPVVVVELVGVLVALDGALVDRVLPVVLAEGLERLGQLEEAVGDRVELGLPQQLLEAGVLHLDGVGGHDAGVGEAHGVAEALEVLAVEGPPEALPDQHVILARGHGQAAVAVHVGEVELAADGEGAVHLREHSLLVGGQVDNAVGDGEVDAPILDARGLEVLDLPLHKAHVGRGVAEGGGVLVHVLARDTQLVGGHVHARHLALLAHQGGAHVAVAPRAAAEVEDAQAVDPEGEGGAAAVVLGLDLLGHLLQDVLDGGVWGGRRAARGGLEVIGRLQNLPRRPHPSGIRWNGEPKAKRTSRAAGGMAGRMTQASWHPPRRSSSGRSRRRPQTPCRCRCSQRP